MLSRSTFPWMRVYSPGTEQGHHGAERTERCSVRVGAKQAKDYGFAVQRGHGADADVEFRLIQAHAEAPILGATLFGDVEIGQQLQP